MKKLQYLKRSTESYEITDPKTRAEFYVQVTESPNGVHFDIGCRGTFSADGASECADLLKELIVRDCYSANVREGEKPGQVKFLRNVSATMNKLQCKQKASFIPPKDAA